MLRPAVEVVSPLQRTLRQAAGIILAVWATLTLLGGAAIVVAEDEPPPPISDCGR